MFAMKKTVILNLLILLFNYSIGQGRQLQNSSIDSRIISLMNARNVPGCVISVVSDNLVLYQGAFGFSYLEKRERVSLNDTRFFAGSVSKHITATEVLKAIEQGYLDENADNGEFEDAPHFSKGYGWLAKLHKKCSRITSPSPSGI